MHDCWGELARVLESLKSVERLWVGAEEASAGGGLRVQEVYSLEVGVDSCAWFSEVRDAGRGRDPSTALGDMLRCGGGSCSGALGKGDT